MAAAFTKCSSAIISGAEDESPNYMRGYACALLEKAYTIDPNIIEAAQYQRIRCQLLELPDPGSEATSNQPYLSCTSALVEVILEYGRQHFPDIINRIMPLPWG